MDLLYPFLDLLIHIDLVVKNWITQHGNLSYLFIFLIIFVETGVVIFPVLPGDSLLFIVGAFCGLDLMSPEISLCVCLAAAILGDQVNFWIGQNIGQKIIHANSSWISRDRLVQTHLFFERFGSLTLVIARFIPFVRTLAPFCAGLGLMQPLQFSLYNILGAMLWVLGVGSLGYFLGEVEWVKAHIQSVVWAFILIPSAVAITTAIKGSRTHEVKATKP